MITKSRTLKFVAGFVGFAMALSFMVATPASAATAADIQSQINSLMATIQSLQSQLGTTGSTAMSTGYTFNTNLTVGSTGVDVMNLQKVLNMSAATQVASTGAGSPGMETSYFGNATKAAVIKFQLANGITPAVGYVGPVTRAKLNTMSGPSTGGTTGTTTGSYPAGCISSVGYSSTTGQPCSSTGTTTLPTGGALTVTAGTQPANSLAPASAARVPFTTIVLTAGSADVTVNSITVQRSGLAQDAVFNGIVLLDQNGLQLGIAKTLNSNHQAMVGDPFVVKAGTSMTLTIAGNMTSLANGMASYAGQVAGLDIVAVNTTATLSGSLPITGAQQTINGTLTLGNVSLGTSSFDPGSSQTQPTGVTGYKFSAFRLTAGSAEQVKLWSVRWNQSGSAGATDLSNVMTYVNGTAYPTTVSPDGKYYTSTFPGGILIDKGNSVDVYVQGDVTGSGSAGRTVKFDLYKTTDVYLSGVTYGYGITPPAGTNAVSANSCATSCGNFTGSNGAAFTPWFQGYILTVSSGSVTTIQKSSSVPAQNIAVNVSNQVLGGYDTNFKGEPVTVQSSVFHFATTSGTAFTAGTGFLTSVTVVDSNGAVVAGPVDAVVDGTGQKVTFTDTITYPTGVHTYTLKGKVPSGFAGNGTIVASFTPSSDWTTVTGQTTGNSVSLATFNSAINLNTMTVKSGAVNVSVATTPTAQNIVAGGNARIFANYQFDASQSGEDIRFSSIPLRLTFNGGNAAANSLNSCQLWDGTTALNTGSNVVNPASTVTSGTDVTFTLDQQEVIPKGAIKTLTLTCNVSSGATTNSRWEWGMQTVPTGVTGSVSGGTITATLSASNGQYQTVNAGTLVITTDPSSPSYAIAAGGSTGNVAAAYKFRASNESINLQKLGLKLTNTASSSAADLQQVTIWNGNTQVGSAVFTGTSPYATSTFNTPVLLTKDTDVILTVKADLADIGTSQPGTEGDLIAIDVNGADTLGTSGTGADSGSTINLATAGSSASTAVSGIRAFNSFPTFALGTLNSSGMTDGHLMRFAITANSAGPVSFDQFKFTVATSSLVAGGGVTAVNLFGYTDSGYSTGISGFTSGQISTSNVSPTGSTGAVTITPASIVTVPAGTTYYFELRGTVAGTQTGSSVSTTLQGDSSYPALLGANMAAANNAALTGGSIIWSPDSTGVSASGTVDWTNGYGIVGLPSSGLIQTRSN